MALQGAEARYSASPRQHDRIAHLVLNEPLPLPPAPKKPKGMSRQEWKVQKPSVLRQIARDSLPDRDIAAAIDLREAWRGVPGTPETLERAARTQQGALARLCKTGGITANQLAAGDHIRAVVDAIRADVALPIASWETRVDSGFRGDAAHMLRFGAVRDELAYSTWRRRAAGPASMLIEMIVDDMGYSVAAARYGMSAKRAKALLIAALDLWWEIRGGVGRDYDEVAIAAAEARTAV